MAAHGDAAGAGVPEARGELGNGRFSAAGRADQRRHFVLRYGQADAVEDLLIRMVAEADVFEHDGMVGKCDRRFAVDLLLRVQDLIHLRDRRAHLRQRIHEIERGHDGRGHAKRQDDNGDKDLRRQRTVGVKHPAQQQDGEHLRGEECVGHRHIQLAAAHPVVIILRVGLHLVHQPGIGRPALVERLDDLNAVYVLDHGGIAAAKGKRAEIQRGEKQLQQNAALFHTHPSRAEYITSCRICKI